MGDPASKRATLADLDALPPSVAGELIQGVLHTMTRPRARHRSAGTILAGDINGPYQRGRGGPGGWWILGESGIQHLALDVEEISPEVAGWRRERMPELPDEKSIGVVPDWVCEVLSRTTRVHDLKLKRPLYARMGVTWMWIVDVAAKTLVASRNVDGKWLELATYSDDDVVRIEPFDAIDIHLADLWG
ncbi:MAG: Uma2 family endonuclease [Polyangiaceae bacterium]